MQDNDIANDFIKGLEEAGAKLVVDEADNPVGVSIPKKPLLAQNFPKRYNGCKLLAGAFNEGRKHKRQFYSMFVARRKKAKFASYGWRG